MTRRMARCMAAAALLGAAATGCSASDEEDAVRAAAEALFGAVRAGDGARACASLVPRAVEGLESPEAPCREQVLKVGLEGGPVGRVEVWSGQARARAGSDTVFLVRWGDGWRVTAAGCERKPGEPYDCEVDA
ncbi:hypothetical protein [Spirillospora sp. CA-294931]|uniref:hypothetical protein n=1 Tax=Spirillospora sp. CA-294931 TaxID=3240042 RepID=UPI003D8EBBC0